MPRKVVSSDEAQLGRFGPQAHPPADTNNRGTNLKNMGGTHSNTQKNVFSKKRKGEEVKLYYI